MTKVFATWSSGGNRHVKFSRGVTKDGFRLRHQPFRLVDVLLTCMVPLAIRMTRATTYPTFRLGTFKSTLDASSSTYLRSRSRR